MKKIKHKKSLALFYEPPVFLRFAQSDSIDYRRVIKLVAENRVFRRQKSLEYAGIRVETRGVDDRVFPLVKFCYLLFELSMYFLSSTDKSNGTQARTVLIQSLLCCSDYTGVIL